MSDVLLPMSLLRAPDRFGGEPQGDMLRGRPVIRNGRLAGLDKPTGQRPRILLPQLVEAHCHLDKCYTQDRIGPVGGTLTHAIETQRADKANWSAEDIRARATRGLQEAQASGCALIRTHVDWGDSAEPPLAWSVLGALQSEAPGLQRAALTGVTQWRDPSFASSVAPVLARDGAALGAFVFDQEGLEDGLRVIFDSALKHALPLDFHVDEGLGAMNGLEAIADTALATGFDGPILCGHAVSLMDRNAADLARIIDKLLAARIHICALPTTNLYLQDRKRGTPDRRGITRLLELHDAGVPIVLGSDNVADAFCPTGAHDPMAALNLAVMAAHLDPPLGRWLPSISINAASAIGAAPPYLDNAPLSQLLTSAATNLPDLVAGRFPLTPAQEALS